MGIEAMFKDCNTGGYNLEGSRANTQHLTNLILLIVIAYIGSYYHGYFIKKSGYQNYICGLIQLGKKDRRHSNFQVGIYGKLQVITWEYFIDTFQSMMNLSPQKKPYYQRRLKAMSLLLD